MKNWLVLFFVTILALSVSCLNIPEHQEDDDAGDDSVGDDTVADDAGDDMDDDTGTTTTTTIATTTSTIASTTTTTTTTSTTTTTFLMEFVNIEWGTFTMGSPVGEPGRETDETQHEVTLTNDFEMSVYETTQEQYELLMGWNPSYFGPNGAGDDCGSECPVEQVNWFDAVAFANEISLYAGYATCYSLSNVVCMDLTNVGTDYLNCMNATQGGIRSATIVLNGVSSVFDCKGYRLPTESEWEYAARTGTTTAYHDGQDSDADHLDCEIPFHLTDIAWYCGNAGDITHGVQLKTPNDWGLFDMSGNVWEWNWDWYASYPGTVTDPAGPGVSSSRTARGGSWENEAKTCRSAIRGGNGINPSSHYNSLGFRLARTLVPVTPGFKHIHAGTFTMGSPTEEPGRITDERQHEVTLTNNFEISSHEMTQVEFESLMVWNSSYFGPNGAGADCGDNCPVEQVSWYDAIAFANELSTDVGYDVCYLLSNVVCEDATNVGANYMNCMNTTQGGIESATVALNGVFSVYDCEGYRLPTESEWEYAARAGTLTAYHDGLDSDLAYLNCEIPFHLTDIAWYCGNDSPGGTKPVGQKTANAWGLNDMSGNVWEWNWDRYAAYTGDVYDPEGPASGSARVFRSGSWYNFAKNCRSAFRLSGDPGGRNYYMGFRVARTLP